MATDTAPFRPRRRNLWQVPMFLVGVASLVGAYHARPYLAARSPMTVDRELRAARAALAASPPDRAAALDAAKRALDQIELAPRRAGEANLLAGLALASETDPAQLAQARHYLEHADRAGVPDADRVPHAYALAKVWFRLGVDPGQVVPALVKVADLADDPFEAYGLLASAYEKRQPADPVAVLEAVRNQVAKAKPSADGRALAAARLRLGELLLAQQNLKEARLTLSRVGSDGPAETAAAARSLLAASFEQSHEWAAAAECWQLLRGDDHAPVELRTRASYRLADCLHRDRRSDDAKVLWSELANGSGAEARAAAIRLAEVALDTQPAAAAEAFAAALHDIPSADGFRNPFLSADELRAVFERGFESLRNRGEYAAAARLAGVYAKVAAAGRADELLGRAAHDWAGQLAEKAKSDPTATAAARDQFRAAAAAYRAAAQARAGTDRATYLLSAAETARKGDDTAAALDALTQYAGLEVVAAADKAKAWYDIGQIHQQLGKPDDARAAYGNCLTADGSPRWRGRYRLAAMDLDDARADVQRLAGQALDKADEVAVRQRALIKFDEAEQQLQTNLAELRQALQPDAEALEWTTFGSAEAAFHRADFDRKDLATAEQHLTAALRQYPDSPLAIKARLQLGRCHWSAAAHAGQAWNTGGISDDDRARHLRQFTERLALAAEQFDKVDEALSQIAAVRPLTADEARQWKESGMWAAESRFYRGAYAEALARYENLAARYANQVEELVMLYRAWKCRVNLKQSAEAAATLAKLKSAVEALPAASFDNSSPQHQREYWDKILADADRRP